MIASTLSLKKVIRFLIQKLAPVISLIPVNHLPCGPGCLERENPDDCSSKCLCEDPFCPQTEDCPFAQEWDFINCGCIGEIIVTDPVCDYVFDCPYWQTWDSNVCDCNGEIIPTCPPIECMENQIFNPETCNCDFVNTGEPCEPCGPGCLERENPDDCSSQCLCEDPFCPQTEDCPFAQEWDFINCGCIGDIIVTGPVDYVFDCSYWQTWDSNVCNCNGEIIPTCPPIECNENQIFNPETCNCDFVGTGKTCEPCEPACGKRENPDDCSSSCDQTGCFDDLVAPTDLCTYGMEC